MFEEWFSTKLQQVTEAATGEAAEINPEEVQALKSFMNDIITVKEAAERLTKRTSTAANLLDVNDSLFALWIFIANVAIDLPLSQPRIVELLRAIQKLPDVDLPGGEGADYISLNQGELWKELPSWGNTWADTSNCM